MNRLVKPAEVGSLVKYTDPRGLKHEALVLQLGEKGVATIKVFRTARKDLVLENVSCGFKPNQWYMRGKP